MVTARFIWLVIPWTLLVPAQGELPDLDGIMVSLDNDEGPATFTVRRLEGYKLQLQLDRNGDTRPMIVRVELPNSGRNAWPVNDVEVRDDAGRAMLVRRPGIEWHKLIIPVPTEVRTLVVQAVEPRGGWTRITSEKDRVIHESTSGAEVRIVNWPQGRTAALSIRFDDSHPSHLRTVIPILREYRFKGTFMVNPGPREPGRRATYPFKTQYAEWEAVMKRGDQELANHSAHHRGAQGDDDMDREIGSAAEVIWTLTPGKSKLMALNLGGGTLWETTRTLRIYLDKYHQFDASSGSLGMDDSYGGRVEAFRKALALHLERGLWCRVHYHDIGDGLSSSEANFRAALDIAKKHQDKLWIAGMADIHKYQTERNSARLTLVDADTQSLIFQLDCATDEALYDQPLSLELTLPATWDASKVTIHGEDGIPVAVMRAAIDEQIMMRFEVPPTSHTYTVLHEF